MLSATKAARPASIRLPGTLLRDVNAANVSAGLTAGLFYAFGAIPIFFGATTTLGLRPEAATSAFFIVFVTSAISSIVLTLRHRQPLPIGFTIPGLVFIATMGQRHAQAEIAGACLVAGVAILALGALGLDQQILRWLPRPIVTGMFAGSLLGYATGIFEHLESQPVPVGAAIAGYLGTRALRRSWLPPVAGAVVLGIAAAAALGQVEAGAFAWQAPALVPIQPALDPVSVFAIGLPLVVFSLGLGHGQGIGYLQSQGFRPPVKTVTLVMGANSLVNAFFGGFVSTVQNNGTAMLGGPDAGPRESRYVASLVAATCALALGLCAATAGALVGVLPVGLVLALAGFGLIGALIESLRRTATAELPVGAFFALVIAASPLSLFGVGPALWSLAGGLIASVVLEREALINLWSDRPAATSEPAAEPDPASQPQASRPTERVDGAVVLRPVLAPR